MSSNDNDSENKIVIRRSKRLSMLENSEKKNKMAKIDTTGEIDQKGIEKKTEMTKIDIIEEIEQPEENKEVVTDAHKSVVCESCGAKIEQITSHELNNMCSSCATGEKELSDELAEKKSKSCEHCKGIELSNDHKMIGCLICMKSYHIDCLLPGDIPSDLTFENNQFFRRKLGCVRCAVVHLCYKVRDIVTWRWREQASDVEDPCKYFMPREFLIHYNFLSYWDCEWVSELQLEMSEPNLYRSYKKKSNFSTPPCPYVLSDGHKRKMSQADLDLHEKYFRWGIDTEWLQPHRVLALDDVGCIVKWRGLGYEYISTEPLTRVKEIYGLQEAIDTFKKLEKDLLSDSNSAVDKSKLTKLSETPNYLGPLIGNAKDKPSLHPYQLEGLNWLRSSYSNNVNTILADEMGLGKTIQAIAFILSLCKDNVTKGPFLVVVPLSTIKNWEREFEFWAPELCVLSYYGDKDCRAEIRNYLYFTSKKKKSTSFHVLLTTYELIYVDDTFLQAINWELLIVDEAHRLKNNESKLFKAFKKYKIKYRNLMTGTPLQNNLEELFHLLNFMEPKSFGNLSEFLLQFQDVSKEEQVKTLQEMLKKHILRRLKTDVLHNLPIKEEQIVRLELTKAQKDLYKMILTKNYEYLGGKFSGIKMTNIMMQLRKVCNHPYLVTVEIDNPMKEDGSYDVPALIAASGKMELLQKMLIKLRSSGHRVLIFSGMTKLLDLMEYMLDDLEVQYERIDGSISSTFRQNAIDRFNDPNSVSLVFLLSTKAGGLGINLSSADTVIIYDSDWNPHNDIQALSRAHRIGQQKKVMIYRFVTRNSVEEKVMETAKKKMMITNLVVKNCTKVEFHQILSFGTKELFDENAADDQKIIYDDAAIDVLLDRNRAEVANSDGNLLDTCFSGFKVADCEFAADVQPDVPVLAEKVPEIINSSHPEKYWVTLLAPLVKQKMDEDNLKEPEFGKGLRNKKKVLLADCDKNPTDNASEGSDIAVPDDKDLADTDYDVSGEEPPEHESSGGADSDGSFTADNVEKRVYTTLEFGKTQDKYVMDKDFKRVVCYGIDAEASRQIGMSSASERHLEKYNRFCIVDGFLPVERMAIYTSLMNYGLPPRQLRRSDFWWPSSLAHKTIDEMCKYIGTLMHNIVESSESQQFSDGVPRDNVDYDLLLARIGLNGLIAFKVNQFEAQNKVILEMLTYKQYDILTQSVDEIKTIFDDAKDCDFEFNIWDGEFSKIHSLWSEYELKTDGDATNNLIFEWNKLHDYMLLSAMALHGYDNYLDLIFRDHQFHVLLVPFKLKNLKIPQNNLEIRKFMRHRQLILENALLIEAQLTKIAAAFDTNSCDMFTLDKLKFYHNLFLQQGATNYVSQGFANTRLKLKAITQLELLINDIESDSDSYRPIEVRKVETSGP